MRRAVVLAVAVAFLSGMLACTHDSRARDEAREAAREVKQEARDAANEAKEAGKEAADEGKAAADEARREAEDARREAEDARREAMAEVRRDGDKDDDDRPGSTSGNVVNINKASAQDITNATGLATNVAQKIVAARPFVSKRDLVSKKIVDEQTYWKIEKHVTVMSK